MYCHLSPHDEVPTNILGLTHPSSPVRQFQEKQTSSELQFSMHCFLVQFQRDSTGLHPSEQPPVKPPFAVLDCSLSKLVTKLSVFLT